MNRTYLFITISSIALLLVLIIQVNWIFQTAKIKEELFNEKANMVLSRTTEALSVLTRKHAGRSEPVRKKLTLPDHPSNWERMKSIKLIRLFKNYMKLYNFHIDYSFVVAKPGLGNIENTSGLANYIYNKPLQDVSGENGVELKLIFPEKKQYIIAEMGTLFITSVILILVVTCAVLENRFVADEGEKNIGAYHRLSE